MGDPCFVGAITKQMNVKSKHALATYRYILAYFSPEPKTSRCDSKNGKQINADHHIIIFNILARMPM